MQVNDKNRMNNGEKRYTHAAVKKNVHALQIIYVYTNNS